MYINMCGEQPSESGGSAKRLSTEDGVRVRGMLATGGRAYPERCVAVELLQPIIGPLIYHLSAVSGLK